MKNRFWERRSLMSGMGAAAAALAVGARPSAGQTPAAAPPTAFTPARHTQDDWLDKIPGKHRVVLDVTTAQGMPDAIRFAGNIYTGNKGTYGLDDADLAIVVILRHSATALGYGDAIWAKYGKALADATKYADATTTEPPKGNPFNMAPRSQVDGLAKRGVHFAVCDTASHGVARRLAGDGGDGEATYKEMVANMIPASRLVAAGVIAVTRAQEFGYKLVFCG